MIRTKLQIDYLNFEINRAQKLKHENIMGLDDVIVRDMDIILVQKLMKGKDLDY